MRKLALLTLVLAACSGGGSEGPLLTFADAENPPATTEVLSAPTTPTTQSVTTTTTVPVTTSTTLLVVDVPAAVTIRSAAGFQVLEDSGAPLRVTSDLVGAGFDDLQGGFVFQLPGAGTRASADQRVFWSRAGSPDGQPYLDVNEGSLLRLWGVEEIEGRPAMVLTIADNPSNPDERIERLVVFDFETGDRVLGEVGTGESAPATVTYGGGRFLLEIQSGDVSRFEFRDSEGTVLNLATNPNTSCDLSCPFSPALDPSGSQLAFLNNTSPGQENGGLWLEVLDIDLGEERARISLPSDLGKVHSLRFDGATVIINRTLDDGELQAVVVDVSSGMLGEFGLGGEVQFLRVPPAFDGPVSVLG